MVKKLKKEYQILYNNALAEIETGYVNWYRNNNADKEPDKSSLLNRETILSRAINPFICGIFEEDDKKEVSDMPQGRHERLSTPGVDNPNRLTLSKLVKLISDIFMNEEQKRGLSLLQQHRKIADERMQTVRERCEKIVDCKQSAITSIKYFTCEDAKCIMDDYYRYIDTFIDNLSKRLIKTETKTRVMDINDFLELEDHINVNCERFNRIIIDYLNLPDMPTKRNYRRYILRVLIIS